MSLLRAQSDTLHFTLHYPEGQFISNEPLDQQLDSLLGHAGFYDTDYELTVKQVIIFGHTDNKGSRKSNQKLSEQRAQYIYGYLLSARNFSGFQQGIVTGMGEEEPIADNKTESGRAANRRCEVSVIYTRKKTAQTEQDPVWGDTVINMGDGSTLRINLADYRRIRSCLTYTRKTSLYDVFEELERLSGNGTSPNYYIFGKISVQWCADQCLNNIATLSIPVPDSLARKYLNELRSYVRNYPVLAGRTVRLVKHSNRKWYVDVSSRCHIEWIGCGYCGGVHGGGGGKRMKIVARNGYRLLYASPYGGGSYLAIDGDGRARRKFKFRIPCPGSVPTIQVIAIKKDRSDTLYYASGTEQTIDFRRRCFNCIDKEVVVKKVLGIKIHKRLLRRKYIIRERNYTERQGWKPKVKK